MEYCYIDYRDANYSYTGGFTNDLEFHISKVNDEYILDFKFRDGGNIVNINDSRIANKTIKMWHQVGKFVSPNGWDPMYPGSPSKGLFKTDVLQNITKEYPLKATDFGGSIHLNYSDMYMNLEIDNNGTKLKNDNVLNFKNANLIIANDKNFELESNSNLIFEGTSRFRTLQTSGTKTITMGNNSLIDVRAGGSINLNRTIFQPTSGSTWKGIKLYNTFLDTVKNCQFSGADTCISSYASDKCLARYQKIITNNTFTNGRVILTNTFQSFISGNSFNSTDPNMYLLTISNNVHPSDPNFACEVFEESSNDFKLNITNNIFSGGSVQLYLNCMAADLIPFYIFGNAFSATTSGEGFGLVGRKVSGDFKFNNFTASHQTAVHLIQSNMNFFGNVEMKSNSNATLSVYSSSSARLAPVNIGGTYYWFGGSNKLVSTNGDNIYFYSGSDLFIDNGRNCFIIDNTNKYHLKGILTGNCSKDEFLATQNNWSTDPPKWTITCNGENVSSLVYEPTFSDCPATIDAPSGYELTDKGDGITDTVFISSVDFLSGDGQDERMFGESLLNKNSKQYSKAIDSIKTLINNYDSSDFLSPALDEIYINYQLIDSSGVQTNTNLLFTDLKNYIGSKIQQHQINSAFVEKAYSYYLMCLIKLRNYNEAISGYENIMNNHPDPATRLFASWDRSAVLLLQSGSGGGMNNLTDERLKKLFDKKPAHQIAKNAFQQIQTTKQATTYYSKYHLDMIENKIIKYNPRSQEELNGKISDDLNVLLNIEIQESSRIVNTFPERFTLHQNYPNPFNPTTSIKYEIPNNSFVTLKVYDVSGKEVAILVNEFQQTGAHEIIFNGNKLSSGIYYYKMEAGNHFQTKKMSLIK